MSEVTLWRGDCLEFMRGMEAGSVDAILTDLPYGTTACSWDAIIPFVPMWAEVKRILKPRGVFVTTASQPFTSKLVMSNLEWFKYSWVWDRKQISNPQLAKIQPLKTSEDICVFGNGMATYNPQGLSSDIEKVVKRRSRWENTLKAERRLGHIAMRDDYQQQYTNYPKLIISFPTKRNGVEHPTQKPVALYEYLIRTYTNPDDTVLDFCFGSGTTGVACVQLGLNFIGCELDPGYFAIAERRIAQAQAQPRLFQDEPQKPKPEQQSFL